MKVYFDRPTATTSLSLALAWIILIVLAILISSCSGKQGYIKYKYNHPEQFAKDCSDAYPVKEKYIKGDTKIVTDTAYLPGEVKDCPEPTKDKDGKLNPGKVQCPGTKVIRDSIFRTDTLSIENTAKLTYLNNQLNSKENALNESLCENKLLKQILGFVLGIAIIVFLVFIYGRKTK